MTTTPSPERQPADAGGKLLPCPWCGGEVEEFVERDSRVEPLVKGHPIDVFIDAEYFGVRCPKCDVGQTNPFIERAYAIAAWNHRTTNSQERQDTQTVEGVRAVLEKMRKSYLTRSKFADHDIAAYYRDFVRDIDQALAALSTPAPQAQPDARAVEGAPVGYFLHNGHEWEEVADQFIGDPDVRPLYLSAPAADDGWRDIATAPKDGRKALVYRPLAHLTHDEPVAVKRLVEGNQHCWPRTVPAGEKPYNPTDGSCHVTHWRPLPAPPVALHPAAPTDEVGK